MNYKTYKYIEINDSPKEYGEMGIKSVYVPQQGKMVGHFALIDKKENRLFSCRNLDDLIEEGQKRINKWNKSSHPKE